MFRFIRENRIPSYDKTFLLGELMIKYIKRKRERIVKRDLVFKCDLLSVKVLDIGSILGILISRIAMKKYLYEYIYVRNDELKTH